MITSAFIDGDTLYCVFPSKSNNGVYIVEVQPQGDKLIITHECPAQRFKNRCSHVKEAITAYYTWKWWDPPRLLVEHNQTITLQPHWEQISVPGSLEDVVCGLEVDPNAP